jgi:hypothetical protein
MPRFPGFCKGADRPCLVGLPTRLPGCLRPHPTGP